MAHWWEGTFNVHGDGGGGAAGESWSSPNGKLLANDTTYHFHATWVDDGHLYARTIGIQAYLDFPLGAAGSNNTLRIETFPDGPTTYTYDVDWTTGDAAHYNAATMAYVMNTAAAGPHDQLAHGTVDFWVDPAGWASGACLIVQQVGANGSGTFTPPAAVTNGHLCFLFASMRTGYPTTPSGWDIVGSARDDNTTGFGNQGYARLFSRVASGEPSSYVTNFESGFFVETTSVAIAASVAQDSIAQPYTTAVRAGGAISVPGPALVIGFALVGSFFAVTVTAGAGTTTVGDNYRGGPPDAPRAWAGTKTTTGAGSAIINATIDPAQVSCGITVAMYGAVSGCGAPVLIPPVVIEPAFPVIRGTAVIRIG